MPAPDIIHDAVRNALIKDGWTITADPYKIEYEDVKLFADLGAERLLAAERGLRRIVVEIKSFIGRSQIHDLELALGQYEVYRSLLALTAPEHQLYLAVSDIVYTDFFVRKAIQVIVQRAQLAILVVNVDTEEVVEWTG